MVEKQYRDEVTDIMDCIQQGYNFLLSGGAGSGKTYSLVQVLKQVAIIYPSARIACITYTNAAAIEIKNRSHVKNLTVSTIHDFLWDTIVPFQKEMKKTLIELINDPESSIKNPNEGMDFTNEFENGIQYKEYVRLDKGEISHDEVIALTHRMYNKYTRLCDLLKDSFQFIFVDEYQDTSPLVINILLDFLPKSTKKNIIGFFGDTMQSIYESGVGNIDSYIAKGQVVKIEKKQNRRNPSAVIHLANKLRTDGLSQEPSADVTAPNMANGTAKEGHIAFLYSENFDLDKVRSSSWCKEWDFTDSQATKELRLTYNLIASEAGFAHLMDIYDSDPITKFKKDFRDEAKKRGLTFDTTATFEAVINSMDWTYKKGKNAGRQHKDVFLENKQSKILFEYVKNWPYQKVAKIYLDKDSLIDDKVVVDNVTIREPRRDRLIQHLFKIQEIISFYHQRQYNDLIQKASLKIMNISDKRTLKQNILKLEKLDNGTIENVINFANTSKLCIIDDQLKKFLQENEYLYWRIKDIPYKEFQCLYQYLEGYIPLSTQHKIKGLEFNNVLIVLNNGGWSNYNFEYLFNTNAYSSLTGAKQKSYPSILLRTKKLFYVCCTRAKENLVVFYPVPTPGVLEGAKELFGKSNCINLDVN